METVRMKLIKGDITKLDVDAVVNAANSSLMGGGGVDGAIHRVGGPAILEECRKIVNRQGGCATGAAVITTGGNLPASFVVHTVGPVWHGGSKGEAGKLADCYRNSLKLAAENGCRTIAFPNISTGVYGFPKEAAAKIAVETVSEYLAENELPEKVISSVLIRKTIFIWRNFLRSKGPRI
jgi:O-acetyl-ADP-ribose deacetylase (regulator of RNase III)